MSSLSFLAIAVVVGAVGMLFLAQKNREVGGSDSAMDAFRREMEALAPRGAGEADASGLQGSVELRAGEPDGGETGGGMPQGPAGGPGER